MIINKEKSELLFKKIDQLKLNSFLTLGHFFSPGYEDFLVSTGGGFALENEFLINGETHVIDYYLGDSPQLIYDLFNGNQYYETSQDGCLVIAILVGDEFLVLKKDDPCVYYYNRDEWTYTKIADDFVSFQKSIKWRNAK